MTRDKVELALVHHATRLQAKDRWAIPFGVLVASVIAVTTSNFKNTLGMSGAEWKAFFVLLTCASAVWLIKTLIDLIRYRGDAKQAIIDEIFGGG